MDFCEETCVSVVWDQPGTHRLTEAQAMLSCDSTVAPGWADREISLTATHPGILSVQSE